MACFSPGFATRSKATRHFRVKLNAVINFMLRASAAEESVIWVALTSETNHGPKDTPQVLLGKASAESELPSGKSRGRSWLGPSTLPLGEEHENHREDLILCKAMPTVWHILLTPLKTKPA
ncbi:unnamed protein product, partial [Rangifer tarandus platyrhynchus]